MSQRFAWVFAAAIFALGLGTHAQVGGDEKATPIELLEKVFPQQGQMNRERLRSLTNDERESVKVYLRGAVEKLRREGENSIASRMVMYLATFGDEWAMEMVVQDFWNSWPADTMTLHIVRQPKTIAMIGEGLFMEERYYIQGDVGITPTQGKVARVALDILGNSPEFSADVINWARRVGENYTMKMMRDWYRANEAKLKAGDFKAVQPGAEPTERKPPTPTQMQPAPSLPAVSTPASVPGIRMQDGSGNRYAWIAALLLALCGGLVWFLKRKRI